MRPPIFLDPYYIPPFLDMEGVKLLRRLYSDASYAYMETKQEQVVAFKYNKLNITIRLTP